MGLVKATVELLPQSAEKPQSPAVPQSPLNSTNQDVHLDPARHRSGSDPGCHKENLASSATALAPDVWVGSELRGKHRTSSGLLRTRFARRTNATTDARCRSRQEAYPDS